MVSLSYTSDCKVSWRSTNSSENALLAFKPPLLAYRREKLLKEPKVLSSTSLCHLMRRWGKQATRSLWEFSTWWPLLPQVFFLHFVWGKLSKMICVRLEAYGNPELKFKNRITRRAEWSLCRLGYRDCKPQVFHFNWGMLLVTHHINTGPWALVSQTQLWCLLSCFLLLVKKCISSWDRCCLPVEAPVWCW